ncbi:MAG: hypothetical protein LBU89_00610, partial [Fibromonadaceae bacterium]|nr:hypothetical protein [Fibromonadaceae bacterium]
MKKSSTLKRLVTATTSKLILMLMLGVQAIFAQPTIWTGLVDTDWYNASETEFTINTAEQLAGLAKLVNEEDNFSGKTVKLGQNIALNDTANWVNWETVPPANVWVPITFNGTFDGNGFVVSGVYMNDNGYNRGLFGSTNSAAIIKNVGVVASYIKANNTVGGLAGSNYGLISNSYFIGTVAGTSYNVGGLVGLNSGIINNSYSVGKVTGTGSVGGLVGGNPPYSVEINSYYNKEISGQSDEGKGVGKTTAEMQSMEFTDSLNFFASILSANAWIYSAGKYPVLSQTPAHTNINISDFFEGGNGTEAHPYIISTKKQLENFSWLVNSGAHFSDEFLKLGRDIVLNDTVNWKNWATTPPANKWTPIGAFNFSSRIGNMFNGTFDGDGFVVSGVYMNNNGYYQGLFGYLDFGGTIKNIGVAASYIKGNSQIGGLVGSNLGTISNSYFTGVIEAEYGFVGGLAGSNSLTVRDASIKIGSISNSYFIGTVKGTSSVGGLVGSNADHMAGNSIGGSISNSYSLGRVIGSGNDIGGLVGGNYAGAAGSGSNRIGGTISNSYSVSRVEASEGSTNVGGLAGSNGNSYYNTNGTISGYYNTDSTSYNNGLGTGKTTAEMRQRTTFPGWNFNAIWGIDSKVNNGYPYLRWSIPDIAWFDDSKSEFLITEPQQLAGFATLVNAGHN